MKKNYKTVKNKEFSGNEIFMKICEIFYWCFLLLSDDWQTAIKL
jgi:hypothetical protein